ncbi:alkylphosphonate utilization protein [Komagataeibacter melaceti]|uniref:Alkylphosphonate utilization protein n=1 Tax=Komagataeibacter melaceti TaxID=2766577 RepID=A0A371Z1T0_9PROT|nr:zinc ribbon domain-containing protein YjdM [Komagataeibacter melaceti]RFD20464.1 alkylphosphonate utilization protein [Komagataeibacter melaceti]
MDADPKCPACGCEHAYPDGSLWTCPECGHEWNPQDSATAPGNDMVIRDANGNVLADGDTVTVIKDLKVKGSSLVVKGGTKVKNIRLADGGDGHDIACKISGIGAMNLKSEFVKKS